MSKAKKRRQRMRAARAWDRAAMRSTVTVSLGSLDMNDWSMAGLTAEAMLRDLEEALRAIHEERENPYP